MTERLKLNPLKRATLGILLFVQFILMACVPGSIKDEPYDYSKMNRATRLAYERVDLFLQEGINNKSPVEIVKHSKIDSIIIDKRAKQIGVYLNAWFGSMRIQ